MAFGVRFILLLLHPSRQLSPHKVRAVASPAAAERKLSSPELEQVEETPQGPAFKATL